MKVVNVDGLDVEQRTHLLRKEIMEHGIHMSQETFRKVIMKVLSDAHTQFNIHTNDMEKTIDTVLDVLNRRHVFQPFVQSDFKQSNTIVPTIMRIDMEYGFYFSVLKFKAEGYPETRIIMETKEDLVEFLISWLKIMSKLSRGIGIIHERPAGAIVRV